MLQASNDVTLWRGLWKCVIPLSGADARVGDENASSPVLRCLESNLLIFNVRPTTPTCIGANAECCGATGRAPPATPRRRPPKLHPPAFLSDCINVLLWGKPLSSPRCRESRSSNPTSVPCFPIARKSPTLDDKAIVCVCTGGNTYGMPGVLP